MACGMTPEIMQMIATAQARQGEAESLEDAERQQVERARARAREVRSKRRERERERRRGGEKAEQGASAAAADWTSTYRQWEDWEDPDELAEQAAREKQEKNKPGRGGAGTACNHDHSAERAVYEMGWGARLAACRGFQTEGNMFFREGQYQRAAVRYHHAITYFEYAIPEDDAQQAALDAARLPVYLNFATCMLKLGSLDEALNYCQQALRIDPRSVKALYRKAQVFRTKEEFNAARTTIEEALGVVVGGDDGGGGDGAADAAGDGSAGDGSAGDGSTGDGSAGDGSAGDAAGVAAGVAAGDAAGDKGAGGEGGGGSGGGGDVNVGEAEWRGRAAAAAEAMQAQQLLTRRIELGRIRQGVASYNRNSQRMGRAMFGGLKKTKHGGGGGKGAIGGGGMAEKKVDDENALLVGVIGDEPETRRGGGALPWKFVYLSDASDSDEDERLLE